MEEGWGTPSFVLLLFWEGKPSIGTLQAFLQAFSSSAEFKGSAQIMHTWKRASSAGQVGPEERDVSFEVPGLAGLRSEV